MRKAEKARRHPALPRHGSNRIFILPMLLLTKWLDEARAFELPRLWHPAD